MVRFVWVLAAAFAFAQTVDEDRENWRSPGRDDAETRFSPLDQIDAANVANLGLVWSLDHVTSAPLVSDGVLYGTLGDAVFGADARTGKLLWRWASSPVGIALGEGKVFAAQSDGRLTALDAATGKPMWTAQASAPVWALRVVKDKLIAASKGVAGGNVAAFDAATGARMWRIETPLGAGMAYDPIPDLLCLSSGIAVKPDTGNLVWNSAAPSSSLLLADFIIDGRARPTAVQFFLDGVRVLDRITGELIHYSTLKAIDAAASFSPVTGLVYIPAPDGLVAFDPASNTEKWRAATANLSAAMATAGNLVFFGDAAYDAATGRRVWREPRLRGVTSWSGYMLGGRQYVVALAGSRLYALALDGAAPFPEPR